MGQGQFSAADVQAAPPQQMGQYSAADVQSAPAEPPSAWDKAGHFASEFWDQVNPVKGVQGLAQLTSSPIESYKADAGARQQLLDKAKASFKNGDYAEGVAHGIYSMIPFAGPNLDRSGEQFKAGDIAGGAGSTLGQAAGIVAPELVKGVKIKLPVGELPERMYQSALKPSTTLPRSEVASAVQTGLENKIPVSGAGVEKLNGLISDLSDKVKAQIQAGSNAGATVDPAAIAQRADQLKGKFATQVTPDADLAAIDATQKEFLKNNPNPIPAADAQAMKQGTYTQLRGKFGELSSATVESQKALARGIKEELETQFPEIKGLNAQQGRMIGLDSVLERAVKRIDNHQLFGIGTPLMIGGGAAVGGAPGAVVSGLMKFVLDNPEVKSKLAYSMWQSSRDGLTMGAAKARLAAYSNALGNSQPGEPKDLSAP